MAEKNASHRWVGALVIALDGALVGAHPSPQKTRQMLSFPLASDFRHFLAPVSKTPFQPCLEGVSSAVAGTLRSIIGVRGKYFDCLAETRKPSPSNQTESFDLLNILLFMRFDDRSCSFVKVAMIVDRE